MTAVPAGAAPRGPGRDAGAAGRPGRREASGTGRGVRADRPVRRGTGAKGRR
ncbi:hypothetical protein [Actinomadura gamaensis]|uniref:Uncharacterized protein n=1 Tax=Actinomadura gamaensis TaxID=1763541 RepID=A0ABV9TZ40_9ACTN